MGTGPDVQLHSQLLGSRIYCRHVARTHRDNKPSMHPLNIVTNLGTFIES